MEAQDTLNASFSGNLYPFSYCVTFRPSIFLSTSILQESICAVDTWEIPIENITFGKLIGKGAFGTVYRATLSSTSIADSQSNLAAKKLNDRGGQERTILKGIESSNTVAVKTIHSMLSLLLIDYCQHYFSEFTESVLLVD